MNRKEKIIIDQILNGEKYFYKNISVDNVVFGYHDRELKVLLLKPETLKKWLLPGGYVFKTETVEEAAYRIVRYRTNLKKLYLSQFKVFSDPKRTKDSNFNPTIMPYLDNTTSPEKHWMFDNFISVGFFALTEYSQVKPTGDFYAEQCQWWDINGLPEMGFDHIDMIKEALKSLKQFTYHYPIGYEFLPEKFTIPDLQYLYETILDKKIDNRNFTKKLVSIGLIEKLNEKKSIGGHRSPFLYKFNRDRYFELIEKGEIIVF